MAVMAVQGGNLVLFQPVMETVLHKGIRLGIYPGIVHRMQVGTVNLLHFKRHPATVAAQVGQDMDVVARAAETGNVGTHFLEVRIGSPFVYVAHGGQRLQLAHLLGIHLVQFFETHHGKLRERQQVVLRDAAAVALQVEIAAQFGWQQVVQPGSLVDALTAHQHQNLVVHHLVVKQRGGHGDQPFAEEVDKQAVVIFYQHLCSQPANVVGHTVPGGQGLEITLKRVVQLHEIRLEHRPQVQQTYRTLLLAQAAPQGVYIPVRQVIEIIRSFGSELIPTRYRVLAETALRQQKLFHTGYRNRVPAFFPFRIVACGQRTHTMFLGMLVARA